ncbi:HIT family protein [Lewinella cohaerens]|uniref:HIT family protein n=1 Tax=Lewinella cohaerens TaxID=70995 RepID=UPI0003694072|nr:HIT family protein [Lewinella cohaerens]
MSSIFTKIISGEIPCYKIAETADFLAFLDIRPRAEGHTLVIPKVEVDYIFDLAPSTYTALWDFARKVAAGVEAVVPCERIGVAVIGLEVPHTHIHLVPINKVGDINFERPPVVVDEDNYKALAAKIAAAVKI